MNYSQTLKKLQQFIPINKEKWNKNYGLEKIGTFLDELGNPHKGIKFIHVGGTSGKGSTATILASILTESGFKVGLHVSPDVITVRERIQINGKLISETEFIKLFEQVLPAIARTKARLSVSPSYFEILLAMAFIFFKAEHCEFVVLEVGLGGRLDATNIIDCAYQILTNVGLDHMAILGNSKELILQDKKEIIKQNSIVVSGIQEKDLQKILVEKIEATHSKLFLLDRDFTTSHSEASTKVKTLFNFSSSELKLENLECNLAGLFQIQNSALAIMMAQQIAKQHPQIDSKSIKLGLAHATLPGRFQIFSKSPLGIIDGAHNPDKITALVNSLKYHFPKQQFITILRFKKRPDIDITISKLKEVSDLIIMTKSDKSGDMGMEPGFDEADIKKYCSDKLIVFAAEPEHAYNQALELAILKRKGILITGSLFMINEFLKIIK